MFKKFMLYALIGVIGVQPCMQAADVARTAQAVSDCVNPCIDTAIEAGHIVASEGKKVIVPLASALFNIGDACVNGVRAGGHILWVTTKLGAKCIYVLSEGCVHLIRFSADHPQFVTGVAVGAGAAYLINKYNKWQAKQYKQQTARDIRETARLIKGQPPLLA